MQDSHDIISQLSPDDARAILGILARDEKIAARIAELAIARLSAVDVEEVAYALYEELDSLEVEEVWDRAGPTRHGYVDPGEAAEEIIDEVMQPYLEELQQHQALNMNAQANQMCMGLLLGLYKFKNESTSEFKDWAGDAPSGFAWTVVDAWKAGTPGQADLAEVRAFVEDRLSGWEIHQLQSTV